MEVDETYIGGEEPGLRGVRQKGKKVLVGVAVERQQPKSIGRCRMVPILPILDASAESLRSFLVENVEPGATVITERLAVLPGRDEGPLRPPARSRAPPARRP